MKHGALTRSVLGLGAVMACLTGLPAQAIATTTSCTEPATSQPFLGFGDSNWYSFPGGESYDSFAGTGWKLSGGAKIVTTTLYDGKKGYVLELPTGAKAVSPATCVNNSYPYLRTMVRSYSGTAKVYIAYATGTGWGTLKPTGFVTSPQSVWQESNQVKVEVGPSTGWRLAQFTLVGTGVSAHTQIYNLALDPRMR